MVIMIALYPLIKTQLETIKNTDGTNHFKFIHLWNDQAKKLQEGKEYDFDKPACFVEFAELGDIQQLGNGNQIYNNMIVRFRVMYNQLDAADGTMEQNLDIYTTKQKVFKAFNRFHPVGASNFVRTSESPDYNHNNISVFIQEYKTTYVDKTLNAPVGGVVIDPPIGLDVTPITVEPFLHKTP